MYLLPELLRHVGQDPNPAAMRFMALGFVLSDWAARRGLSSRSLAWGVDRVLRALELGQLEVVFDAYGRQSGHVLWTGCDDDLHQRLLAGGPDVAGPLELGRGPILWALDAALRNGVLDAALLALRDRVWPQAKEIFYFRARPAGLQARMLVRAPQLALFRRAGAAADPQSAEMALRASTRQGHAARAELAAAAELGRILWLLRRCATFSRAPLGAAMARVRAPMRQGLTRLHCDAQGEPLAFMSWGWMQPHGLTAEAAPLHALPAPRWSDGTALVLCDAVAAAGAVAWVDQTLRGDWFAQEPLHLYPTDWQPGLRSVGVCWAADERVSGWADALAAAAAQDSRAVVDVARVLAASRAGNGGADV